LIAYHTREATLDEHIRQCQLELSAYVLKRKIIYLDTNFWLTLRDVKLGRKKDSLSQKIYELITLLSDKEVCLFPISETTFVEVLKQSDEVTLNETVSLIDTLSKGICLACMEDRIFLEILQFMYKNTNKNSHNTTELVWTKLPYILGYNQPPLKNKALQKSFFNRMWDISMREMMSIMKKSNNTVKPTFKNISNDLNTGKFSHTQENNSFKQMFMSELGGLMDTHKTQIVEAFVYLYEKKENKTPSSSEVEQNAELVVNMFYNLFKLNKITTELPSFRIPAGLHAAIRWDKNQNYQENDIHDIGHATAALPYCNFFFTERRLAHLITQKTTAYDKIYKCRVAGSIKAAVSALEEIQG